MYQELWALEHAQAATMRELYRTLRRLTDTGELEQGLASLVEPEIFWHAYEPWQANLDMATDASLWLNQVCLTLAMQAPGVLPPWLPHSSSKVPRMAYLADDTDQLRSEHAACFRVLVAAMPKRRQVR